jgi:hypothetical protein
MLEHKVGKIQLLTLRWAILDPHTWLSTLGYGAVGEEVEMVTKQ